MLVTANHSCSSAACLNADPSKPCVCKDCGGHDHGAVLGAQIERGRVAASARNAAAGGVFEALRVAGGLYVEDEPF